MCVDRYSSGNKNAGPSKGSALEIAEAYKRKKIEEGKAMHGERSRSKKMSRLRKVSPLPVSSDNSVCVCVCVCV